MFTPPKHLSIPSPNFKFLEITLVFTKLVPERRQPVSYMIKNAKSFKLLLFIYNNYCGIYRIE